MKLSSFEFWGQPSEVVDFKDEVTTLLNYGKYSAQVLKEATTSPSWKGREGESVYAYATNSDATYTFRTYYWVNSAWIYTTFIGTISDNTLQPQPPPDPTNVLITTGGHIETDGTYIPYFDVSWTAPYFTDNLESYAISYSEDSGVNWVSITIVDKSETTFRWLIPDINTAYIVRVKSVGMNGEYSTGAQSSETTHPGYSTAPALVANFSAGFTDRIDFTWDANTENDISEYEIRSANANWGSGGGVQIFHGNALRYTLVTPPSRTPGTYYIKAKNLSNIFSVSANSFAPTNPGPSAPSVSTYEGFGFASLDWTNTGDADLQHYNIYRSYTNLFTGEETLKTQTPGTRVYVQGNSSILCNVDTATATTVVDSTNLLSQTSGSTIGNLAYITSGIIANLSGQILSHNTATGTLTVDSWSAVGGIDSYTKLLIDFDGADGATSHTAATGQTVTFVGTAQLDTAQKKFGTASLLLDGDSDYGTLLDSDDWNFGTGEFTIDMRIRFADLTQHNGILYQDAATSFLSITLLSDGTLYFWSRVSNANVAYKTYTPSLSEDTWYHFAFVRSGDNLLFFIDGTQEGSTYAFVGTKDTGDLTSTLKIGYGSQISGVNYFNGWIDEFRVSKGIARWTSDFTPPTSAYNNPIPYVGSKFEVRDTEWYKVVGVDTYGEGTRSTAHRINFTPLSEGEIGDEVIRARTLYSGEVITLGAQIRDAIITNAHINDLSVNKLTADTMSAVSMTINAGGDLRSENYVADTAGFKLDGTDGLELNTGKIFGLGIKYQSFVNVGFTQFAGDGSDGSLTITSASSISNAGVKQYNNLTINSGQTLDAQNCVIGVKGKLTIIGKISADSGGNVGGSGDSSDGGSEFSNLGSGGGGGAGADAGGSGGDGGDAGGLGGVGIDGSGNGNPGENCSIANTDRNNDFFRLHHIIAGRGGGGGGGGNTNGGDGGDSGGFVYIECNALDFRTGASVTSNGEKGDDRPQVNHGAGGGGGGGTVNLRFKYLVATDGTLSAIGGPGGSGLSTPGVLCGGSGGNGTTRLERVSTV